MNKIKELLAQRRTELDAAKALREKAVAENRDLTDEELSQVETHLTKADELKGQIETAQERVRKQELALDKLDAADGWEHQLRPTKGRPVNPAHGNGPAGDVDIVGGDGSKTWSCFGEWLHSVKRAGVSGQIDERLTHLTGIDHKVFGAASGLGIAVDSEGGYLIPPEYREAIVKEAYESGQILSRCSRTRLTGNTLSIPYVSETSRATGSRWGGVQGYWLAEGETISTSHPKFANLELKLKKCAIAGYVSEEMLQDYGASSSLMQRAFTEELTWMVEDAVLNGTGAGQPLGITKSPALISIAKESSQAAASIWGANIVKMWARMPARQRPNAVWLVNQDCETQLWGLGLLSSGDASTTDVIPLYYPAGSLLNAGRYAQLMARPVIPVEYCATLGTANDILLVALSEYLLADKGGINVASSIHVRFLNDEQTFRVTYRVDGQPTWASALTPANGSNTLSPYINLATRA